MGATDRETLALRLLGAPRLEAAGDPVDLETRKATALLAYLTVVREAVSRDALVSLLWPEADQNHGRAVLRRTLYALNKTPFGPHVQATRDTVRLLESGMWSDVWEFESELGSASRHEHPPGTRCPECLDHLTKAAGLYRGAFLEGFHIRDSVNFDDWQFFESERLQGVLAEALERLAFCRAAFGAYPAAVEAARRWLALDSLNERAHGALMLLQAWWGRPAAALRQYQECFRVLRDELGMEPSEEISALNDAILEERAPPPPAAPGEALVAEVPVADERRLAALLCVRSRSGRPLLGAAAGRAVGRYGGRLIHSLPGELLAVFGLERTHEGQSEIAVRAALDLMTELSGERLRAGVATGAIELRGSGAAPSVEGQAVRQAARLAAAAEPGRVLAGEATARLARDAFAFVPLGVTRGPELALRAYEVQGLLPEARKTRGGEGFEAAMIGRRSEAATLKARLDRALRGEGQVVCITGEAGIGKSRLVAELRRTAGAGQRCQWLEGRCLDIGSTASYWPFLDLLRGLAVEPAGGTQPGEALARTLTRLTRAGFLRRPRAGQIQGILDLLATGLPDTAADDPAEAKERTFAAIRDLFFALAQERPLVLVFEDLHWADSLSLDLIGWLLDQGAELPLLMVCVYRPEREHRCAHLAALAGRKCAGRFAEIVVRDLDPVESRLLVESLLTSGDLPSEIRDTILTRSQGNPFFLEEVTRSLVDEGVLTRRGGGWGVREESPVPALPMSVRDVILGRFGRLDARLRSLLQIASVVGPLFDPAVLVRIVGGGSWVEAALWELEDRGFVYETRTIPRREYSFKHVLTQEAIYEAIAPARRRSMHAEAARTLEELHEGHLHEVCEALALHLERSGDAERAMELYRLAGDKAKERHAPAEAVVHLERALDLLDAAAASEERDRRELELRVALGLPLVLSAGHSSEDVGRNYTRALDLCRASGATDVLFQVTMGLRRFALARGDMHRSLELSKQLLASARGRTERSRAHMMQTEVMLHLGRFDESIEHSDRVIAAAGRTKADEQIRLFGNDSTVGAQSIGGLARWVVGQPDAAAEQARQGIARARELGGPFNLGMALYFESMVRRLRREPEAVALHARELAGICEERAFRMYQPLAAGLLAWSQAYCGDAQSGVAAVRLAVDEMKSLNIGMFLFYLPELADACLRAGRTQEGLAAVAEALELAADNGQVFWESELHRLHAELLAISGDRDAALAATDRSLEVARRQGALSFELRAALTAARLAARRRGPVRLQTRARLEAVYARFAEGLDTADLTETRELLGRG